MNELLREKQRVQREGFVIREITNVQVRIPQCCLENRPDCVHAVQRKKLKKGNVGL